MKLQSSFWQKKYHVQKLMCKFHFARNFFSRCKIKYTRPNIIIVYEKIENIHICLNVWQYLWTTVSLYLCFLFLSIYYIFLVTNKKMLDISFDLLLQTSCFHTFWHIWGINDCLKLLLSTKLVSKILIQVSCSP